MLALWIGIVKMTRITLCEDVRVAASVYNATTLVRGQGWALSNLVVSTHTQPYWLQ